MTKDNIGNRMKSYESISTSRKLIPLLPVYVRIDGRSFSRFTKKANKPFDLSISNAMHEATKELLLQTHAAIAYVQSDEISLVYEPSAEMMFGGKIHKWESVLAAMASTAFFRALVKDEDWNERQPNWMNKNPHFDARVIQMPSKTEVANMMLWREMDARRNAVSMLASSLFSHKSLQNTSTKDRLARIEKHGVDFDSYPSAFRLGTFYQKRVEQHVLTEEERMSIPERKRPEIGKVFFRNVVAALDMPPFCDVANRVEVIFEAKDAEHA